MFINFKNIKGKQTAFLLIVLIGSAVIVVSSCKKKKNNDPEDPVNLYASFDRKGMLTNQCDNIIIPSWNNLKNQCDSLINYINLFSATTNSANLLLVQSNYTLTYLYVKQVELYQFGPVENQVLWGSLDFWPPRPSDINNLILNNTSFTESFIASKGTTVKGMPALEYMLFDKTNGNTKILGDFTTAADAVKRKSYILGMAQNFKTTVSGIVNDWQTNYRNTFVSSDAQDVSGSINITVNRCIQLVNYMKDMKIGKPFGKRDGILYPNDLEAIQCNQTLNALKYNLKGLENILRGKSSTGNDALGYDDFLNHLNKDGEDPVWPKIETRLNDCNAKINAITLSLQDALTMDSTNVNNLYTSLKQLLVLIQVDMVARLGVTLTFTDSDGD